MNNIDMHNRAAVRDRVGCVRNCERVTLTMVTAVEGAGQNGDPVREVMYFYDDDGWLVARRDGWLEANPPVESIPG